MITAANERRSHPGSDSQVVCREDREDLKDVELFFFLLKIPPKPRAPTNVLAELPELPEPFESFVPFRDGFFMRSSACDWDTRVLVSLRPGGEEALLAEASETTPRDSGPS